MITIVYHCQMLLYSQHQITDSRVQDTVGLADFSS